MSIKPVWLKGRDGTPALQLFGAEHSGARLTASCFYAPVRLSRRRALYLDGARYKPSATIPAGFHNGPVLRSQGKDAPDVFITLERL